MSAATRRSYRRWVAELLEDLARTDSRLGVMSGRGVKAGGDRPAPRQDPFLGLFDTMAEMLELASANTGPDDPVLVTAAGTPRSRHNLRQDVVEAVVRRAEQIEAGRHGQPLPLGITPHKLRHTFASALIAIGKDPVYVMSQLGHTDPACTLRVYAHMMRRAENERELLRALVEEGVMSLDQPQTSHKSAKSGYQSGESIPGVSAARSNCCPVTGALQRAALAA